jgi:hypothetical protein
MVNKLITELKNIENSIKKIMFKGFTFSFLVCLLSIFILLVHILYPTSHIVYKSSLILFRTGLLFAVQFLVCAFVMNKIKKEMA